MTGSLTPDDFSCILEDADRNRLDEILALQRAGLSTWKEDREAVQIRRRMVLRRHRAERIGR